MKDQELERYRKRRTNRIDKAVDRIASMVDEEDMMIEILGLLPETEIIPTIGKYYTFIYTAKTPELQYDQHPLIACTSIYPWGFTGLNYHWPGFHNYTWQEVQGLLHVVYPMELTDLRTIPYQKFITK